MINHPFVPADWQQDASVILLPLEPQPIYSKPDNTWVWDSMPCDLFWFVGEEPGEFLYDRLPYKVGDRLNFQGEWKEIFKIEVLRGWLITPQIAFNWGCKVFEGDRLCRPEEAKTIYLDNLRVRWNELFPAHQWNSNLWIVALKLKEAVEDIRHEIA